ncbi:MAG: DUF2254 domain-containing protein [Gemmatimonadaceae bacterium]
MSTAHSSRLGLAWTRVRDSLWFLPTLAVVIGGVLAFVAVQVPTPSPESRFARVWLFGGGAEGARGVRSAIAGSLITVTGTVFSVTIVALQLASSQFTPRVLRSFVADRVNQAVLGVFIGTFTYTLLVLRTIHSPRDGMQTFVPQVGVIIALLLLLVSIAALILFINHSAQSIRVSIILHRETRRTLGQIAEIFPESTGEPAPGTHAGGPRERQEDLRDVTPEGEPATVAATESGYVQSVHAETLWRAGGGQRDPLTIRMDLHVGTFAFRGKTLVSVWPAQRVTDDVARLIRAAFVLAPERTPEQDVEFGLVEISDIGVKSLSPGINDPTTAMRCIDRLTELLAALSTRQRPATVRSSPDRSVRLLTRDTSFERAVGLAFDQIRHYGASNPGIAKKLLESLGELGGIVPVALRHVVAEQVKAVTRAARREIADEGDLALVEQLAASVTAAVQNPLSRSMK